eukprot:TRINITY_DN63531_c0_g1_i1.p1 TRINITY_DN63531_c0_g1~~TRINITY_DN63531_c0_g1_i1.p1  ORF type:complete len:347 (+),score=36.95 TRINITY_DN63531_c0_g1_i1:269-1309(+)
MIRRRTKLESNLEEIRCKAAELCDRIATAESANLRSFKSDRSQRIELWKVELGRLHATPTVMTVCDEAQAEGSVRSWWEEMEVEVRRELVELERRDPSDFRIRNRRQRLDRVVHIGARLPRLVGSAGVLRPEVVNSCPMLRSACKAARIIQSPQADWRRALQREIRVLRVSVTDLKTANSRVQSAARESQIRANFLRIKIIEAICEVGSGLLGCMLLYAPQGLEDLVLMMNQNGGVVSAICWGTLRLWLAVGGHCHRPRHPHPHRPLTLHTKPIPAELNLSQSSNPKSCRETGLQPTSSRGVINKSISYLMKSKENLKMSREKGRAKQTLKQHHTRVKVRERKREK